MTKLASVAKLVQVRFKCTSCDKFFVDDSSFVQSYKCEDDSEFWEKGEGRNCPTCHKFGSNTDGHICPECNEDIEEINTQADPDACDIVDANGDTILTKKGASKKEKQETEQAKRAEDQKARRAKYEAILNAWLKKNPPCALKRFHGEAILVQREFKIFDSAVTVYAELALSSSFWFDRTGKPFTLSFRINSEGYASPHGDRGGFNYEAGLSEEFEDLDLLLVRAKERIAMAIAEVKKP